MGSAANSVFTEVLEVKIDVASFKEGLSLLEQEYDSFVDRVNAKGFGAGNVLGIGGFSSLTKDITNLQQQLDTYAEHFSVTSNGLLDALGSTSTSLTEKVVSGTSKVDAAASSAKAQVQGLKEVVSGGSGVSGGGFVGQFVQSLAEVKANLPGILANVLAYSLAYKAVNLAIQAVTSVFTGMVDAFKDGFKYLEQFEQKAATIQSVLADKAIITFAKDDVENLQKAKEASEYVARTLEDAGARLGIGSDKLQKAFLAFSEAGGLKAVNGDLTQAVKTVELLVGGLQSAGANVENSRIFYTEITNLLQGHVAAHAKILAALHMNADEANKWLATHKEQGDLYDALAAKLGPVVKRIEDADDRMLTLSGRAKLLRERLEAIFADPLFESWKNILKESNTQLVQYQDTWEKVAHFIGEAAKQLAGFGAFEFGNKLGKEVESKGFFSTVLNESENGLFSLLGSGTPNAPTLPSVLGPPKPPAPIAVGNPDITTPKKVSDLLLLREAEAAYQEELEKVKNKENEVRDAAKEAITDRTTSVKAGQEIIIQSYKDQFNAIDSLIDKLEAEAHALEAAGAKHEVVATVVSRLEKQRLAEKISTDNAIRASEQTITKDQQAQDKETNTAALNRAHETLVANLNQERALEAAQHITKLQFAQSELGFEEASWQERKALLQEAINQAGADVLKRKEAESALALAEQKYDDDKKVRQIQINSLKQTEYQNEQQHIISLQQAQLNLDASVAAGDAQHTISKQRIIETNQELAKRQVLIAQQNVLLAEQARDFALTQQSADALVIAAEKLVQAQTQLQNAKNSQDKADFANIDATNLPDLIKSALKDGADGLKAAFDGFSATVETLAGALSQGTDIVKGIVGAVQSGIKSGGTLGGIGAGMSAAAQYDPEPISHAILAIGGGVLSLFGSIFAHHAQVIADRISKEVQTTMAQFQAQNINLITAIGQLQAERAQAIAQLSGQKGGKDQLNKLLPGLDQQIAQLQLQAKQIVDTFNQQTAVLRTNSDVLGSVLTTWQQINKQVKDYIGAGGDAATAAEYLSLNLAKIRQTNIDSLAQGEASAIQEAISLNGLLQQRIDLTKQFNQSQFNLINGDAVERHSSAVDVGIQAQTAKQQYDTQLAALNNQITQATARIDKEKQIFNIANDTATLQARANALDLISLDQQIQKWKDMQTVIASIYQRPDGSLGLGGSLGGGTTVGAINITVNTGGAPVDGAQLGSDIAGYLNARGRYGTP
jgi:hypothetical protein